MRTRAALLPHWVSPTWGREIPGKASAPQHPQELISEHFGEDGTTYEAEIRELADLRQVGGPCPPRPHPDYLWGLIVG